MPRIVKWNLLNFLLLSLVFFLLRFLLARFFPGDGAKSYLDAYVLGLRFDWRIIAVPSLLTLIFALIKPIHPFHTKAGMRLALSVWFLFVFLIAVFYTIDFAHYSYLKQRLNASALNYLDDASISMSMVWESYPVLKMLLGMVLFVWLFCWCINQLYNFSVNTRPVSKPRRIYTNIIAFVFAGLAIFGKLGQYPLRWSDAFNFGDDYTAQLSLNPFQSFFSTLKYRATTYDLKNVQAAYPAMKDYLGIVQEKELSFARTIVAKPADSVPMISNVVLVICESFSYYKSSLSGSPLNTTPFFDSLSKQGILFDRCFTPLYGTARGVWATMTSIPDVNLGNTASRNPGMVSQRMIMNEFVNHEKFYFIGGSASWANIRGLLKNNIDSLRLYEQDDYASEKVDVWGISDKNLFLESNKVLAAQTKPFFAVIQTADNHRPYTIPKADAIGFELLNLPKDTLNKYGFDNNEELNAFRFTDYCFKTFMEAAQKEKYFANTLFVFIGDHGIGGNAKATLPALFTNQILTQFHVPLLFYAPGKLKTQRYHMPASQIDVMPTIAGLLNINHQNTSMGRNLLNAAQLQKDSGRSNTAMMLDYGQETMGIYNEEKFYQYNLKSGQSIFKDLNGETITDPVLMDRFRQKAEGFYETARYLLLNNKRK
jgi:glucan phosphoethanolaminetransferase (alkaline phosphatase superfamily)